MVIDSLIERAWQCAVDEVKGEHAVALAVGDSGIKGPLCVAAIGKAAPSMLIGLIASGVVVDRALVVTKDAHSNDKLSLMPHVCQLEAAHPVPDQRSLIAGLALRKFVDSCGVTDHLLLLVSGGASALVEHLQEGETLESLQSKTQSLLAAGADIAQINTVRRSLSQLKGGRLCANSTVQLDSWMLSDVEGDDPMVIGSGIGVLPDSDRQRIIASNATARASAEKLLKNAGVEVLYNEETLYGDVFTVARRVAQQLISGKPGAYIIGGEPTVVLPEKPGEGGRNQALALALGALLADQKVVGLVAGTDGTDGPTLAAGGWFGRVVVDHHAAQQALRMANSGRYLRDISQDFVTGPTGTNVMDILIAIKS